MDEVKESPKSSNTNLYVVFLIVLVLIAGGAFYFGRKSGEGKMIAFYEAQPKPSGFSGPRPSGPPNMKGQKFSDTNFYSNAVLIYPGALSKEAQAVTTGWQVNSKTLSDGTTQVDLIPVGSEATEGDTAHTFNLAKGDKLYFVDINPNDDNNSTDSDNNKNDDMGIVVGSDGIVK